MLAYLHEKTLFSKAKIKQTEPKSPLGAVFNKKHSTQSITIQHTPL